MSLSLSVLSQSGPPKSVGRGSGGSYTSTGQYIGVATFFFLFFGPGLKLDEKSIEISKVRNVRLGVFSGGGCHHPNVTFAKNAKYYNYRFLTSMRLIFR